MSTHDKIRAPDTIALCLLMVATYSGCMANEDERKEAPPPTISASSGDIAAIDDRVPIQVDAATRYAVLKEMRTMLNAVQGIVGGAARGDTAAMRASATSAGMMAASESGENVAAQLGAQFVQLGMLTHATFDSLAIDVTQGKSREAVLRRLSTVMGNCVGCHNRFRLVVQP